MSVVERSITSSVFHLRLNSNIWKSWSFPLFSFLHCLDRSVLCCRVQILCWRRNPQRNLKRNLLLVSLLLLLGPPQLCQDEKVEISIFLCCCWNTQSKREATVCNTMSNVIPDAGTVWFLRCSGFAFEAQNALPGLNIFCWVDQPGPPICLSGGGSDGKLAQQSEIQQSYFRQNVNINIKTGALKLSSELLGIW